MSIFSTLSKPVIAFVLMSVSAFLTSVMAADALSEVPLCPGLTIVTAVNQTDGDYESIKRVTSINEKEIAIAYASERMVADEFTQELHLDTTRVSHAVLAEDQRNAPMYLVVWTKDMPRIVPGTTSLGLSRALFESLKKTGKAELTLVRYVLPGVTLDRSKLEYIFNGKVTYSLTRDPKPASLEVLVNGRSTLLPAVRATGDSLGDKVEFFFLDDPRNPITLKFRLGIDAYKEINQQMRAATGKPAYASDDHDLLRVVRISFACGELELPAMKASSKAAKLPEGEGEAGASGMASGHSGAKDQDPLIATLEESLDAKGESVDIYDIFFSFNSAIIRPESEPTLTALVALMKKHGDWKLSISGHTDSIASDSYNLQLSARRAEAVKAELSKRGISAARLATQGVGEARPRDRNDTLEGRARNRRVELIRQ